MSLRKFLRNRVKFFSISLELREVKYIHVINFCISHQPKLDINAIFNAINSGSDHGCELIKVTASKCSPEKILMDAKKARKCGKTLRTPISLCRKRCAFCFSFRGMLGALTIFFIAPTP